MIQTIKTKANLDKGHKIIAALYLITDHISDNDPLRLALRSRGIALIDRGVSERVVHVGAIQELLRAAVLARLVSERNADIINAELKYFVYAGSEDDVRSIFNGQDIGHIAEKQLANGPTLVNHKGQVKSENSREDKQKRHESILSFINQRKSATIKDISLLFPGLSEKTIQRELGALVLAGKITKRGEKRWSIYLANS